MSWTQPQPNTSHTCTHIHTHKNIHNTHMHLHTYISVHTNKTERTQNAHNLHTLCTHTEHRYRNKQSCTEQRTTSAQNNTLVHTLFTYIVLILLYRVYIEKFYNTAIYEYYTFCSPYWWGEQITITLIYWRYYIENSYIMILINLISYYSTNNNIDTLIKHYT